MAEVKVWQAVDITAITLSPNPLVLRIDEEDTAVITAEFTPANATNKTLIWTSSNESVATVASDGTVTAVHTGTVTITAAAVDGSGVNAECTVNVDPPLGAVDMGILTTREDGSTYELYWAEKNLGAEYPRDPGYRFAWGETEPKEIYTWGTYKWSNPSNKVTKYCPTNKASNWIGEGEPDNKLVLDPEDDAAQVMLGGKWRMPTEDEWLALLEKCNKNYDDGKRLYELKYKGATLILPASKGDYYWCPSLYTDDPTSANILFYNDSGDCCIYFGPRFVGYMVRPVYER